MSYAISYRESSALLPTPLAYALARGAIAESAWLVNQRVLRAMARAQMTFERRLNPVPEIMAKKISKSKNLVAQVRELLARPYSRVLVPSDDGLFSAELLEFPGCSVQAETPSEAYVRLERRAQKWLIEWLEKGRAVPRPFLDNHATGRFALRLPRSLYVRASRAAARESVSLNQYIANAVAERVGASTALAAWVGGTDVAKRQTEPGSNVE